MLPKTKYLVAILTVGVGFFGAHALSSPIGMGSLGADVFSTQEASVFTASEYEPSVVVLHDTTRETMRASLRERLSAYNAELKETAPEPVVSPVTSSIQEVEETIVQEEVVKEREEDIPVCTEGSSLDGMPPSWGTVTVRVGEGARVLRSALVDASGIPLYSLQLPLEPKMRAGAPCRPKGSVGLLLDGTVITAGTKVVTDAEGLVGYAADGFPIYAPFEDGRTVKQEDLDVCHGHMHDIIDQGAQTSRYHYHITDEAPYVVGCFRGEVN